MSEEKVSQNRTTDNEELGIRADVIVDDENDYTAGYLNVDEEIEQVGKDIVLGRKTISYENGKNVISVIINAISVRINMPRGTVKALMACIAVILVAIIIFVFNASDINNTSEQSSSNDETSHEYAAEEGKAVNKERSASTGDYVIISSNYRYSLPEEVLGIWEPSDYYAENETFCEFNSYDSEYTIRSYLLDYIDAELVDIVKADLSQFDNMKFLDEQNIEWKYGDILRIKFEATDEDGLYTAGTGYYWYDSDPKICCIEISSDDWHNDGTEEMIIDSVFRVPSNSSIAPPDAEEIWQEQQKEEAMNSLVEDAINDYYEPEPDDDPLF